MDLETLYKERICGENREEFEAYRALILEYNQRYNLTTVLEEKDMYIKHFLDSSAGVDLFKKDGKVAEIGSGAGFPSIVLKILRKDLSFSLFESVGKKCEFLHAVVDKLGLKGVYIYNIRAEDAARDKKHRDAYDHATARAVARMNLLTELCLPLVKVGGKFVAMKGASGKEELAEAEGGITKLGGTVTCVDAFTLLSAGERVIITVDKVAPTPPAYPRPWGKIKKKPL